MAKVNGGEQRWCVESEQSGESERSDRNNTLRCRAFSETVQIEAVGQTVNFSIAR